MTLRSTDPDEPGLAKSLLDGHPVPALAAFPVAVKEQRAERLRVPVPWWQVSRFGRPAPGPALFSSTAPAPE